MEKQFYNFVKEVYDKQLGVEGIAIADGEKILMEHHFTPDQARNIYSHTKSYMSTAVGLAIADGKLSLDDRLAEFFPEAVPENAQPELFEKEVSNMVEVRSRGASLFGLTTYGQYAIEDTVNFTVYVPRTDPLLTTSLAVVPLQLLAYYISCAKGLDVDKPRNLAKSVTVE